MKLPVGKPVTIVLENKGVIPHDITVEELGIHIVADSGGTARATVTVEKEGTYEMICAIPDSLWPGMAGTARVAADVSGKSGGADQEQGEQGAQAGSEEHVSHASVASTKQHGNEELKPKPIDGVKVFELEAQHVKWEVLPGEFMDAYAYNGQVPGPVIRVTEGDRVRVNFRNRLPEPTAVHFHGPTVPNAMDGVPDVTQPVVEPGGKFTYEFVARPGGTFVYHTHHNSAVQEPKGLYGLFIVEPKHQPKVADVESGWSTWGR